MKIVGQTWLNLLALTVGHEVKVSMTLISRSSDFALYRQDVMMSVHRTLGL